MNTLVLWLYGRQSAGKSTIAKIVAERVGGVALDSDAVRSGLSSDLKFSARDRDENIRRMAEVANLIANQGIRVVVASVSPRRKDRQAAARIIGSSRFLAVCLIATKEELEDRLHERRDPKAWASHKFEGPCEESECINTQAYSPAECATIACEKAQWRHSRQSLASLIPPPRK